MSDFFSQENEEDRLSHFEELGKRRSTKWRAATIASVVLTVFAVVAVFALTYYALYPSVLNSLRKNGITGEKKVSSVAKDNSGDKESREETTTAKVTLKPISDILVVGVEEVNGKQVAKGLLLARIDFKSKRINGINISERTYVNIEGLGLDQINKSFTMGLTATKETVHELTQVPLDNHLVLNYDDFEYLVSENRFKIAFSRAIESSYVDAERKAFAEALSVIDQSNSNIFPLPVKYISVNGEPFYEPDNDGLRRLLSSLWGIKLEVKIKPTRVIILNGSGKPGVGQNVSDLITANGYLVVDIRNASSFNFKATQVIAYKEEFVQKAKAIKQLIGVGNVVVHVSGSQDVAEVAIIIGHDYKPINIPKTTATVANTAETTSTGGGPKP